MVGVQYNRSTHDCLKTFELLLIRMKTHGPLQMRLDTLCLPYAVPIKSLDTLVINGFHEDI